MISSDLSQVKIPICIENLADLWDYESGRISAEAVRSMEIADARLATQPLAIALPSRTIRKLGLGRVRKAEASGARRWWIADHDAVRVTILDRFCTVDVMEVPDDVPALVGQIPLEMLDLVVDARNRKLICNPAHNGEHVLELL